MVRSPSAAPTSATMLARAAFERSRHQRRTNTAPRKPASRMGVLCEETTVGLDLARTTVSFVGQGDIRSGDIPVYRPRALDEPKELVDSSTNVLVWTSTRSSGWFFRATAL